MDPVTTKEKALGHLAAVGGEVAGLPLGGRTADPGELIPAVVSIDDTDSPGDVIDALGLAPFVAGTEPHSCTARLDEVRDGATLLPPDIIALRTAREPG